MQCLRLFASYLIYLNIFIDIQVTTAITCYCNNVIFVGADHRVCKNNRCSSNRSSVECYASQVDNKHTVERGCTFFPHCLNQRSKGRGNGRSKIRCCKTDLCNDEMKMPFNHTTPPPTVSGSYFDNGTESSSSSGLPTIQIVIYTILPVTFCAVLFMFFFWRKYFRKCQHKTSASLLLNVFTSSEDQKHGGTLGEYSNSGSGEGLPLLVLQTISHEIKLGDCIGKGSFGAVYHGTWRAQDVAVKIFPTSDEGSWLREVQVYQTTMLRHKNILGFIASDSKDTGNCTQLWLVCDYHENGSLYDFLQKQTVSVYTMVKMIYGIIDGLWHLHSEIVGRQGKPAMAHRDIKTKNILVKNDYTCCIGDLGLTVLKTTIKSKVDVSPSSRTGTRRYQSPEILSDEMDFSCFESYQRADVYAAGLCIWEICRKSEIEGEPALSYELPYYDVVQQDPSEEEMRQAVCIDGKRPQFPSHWYSNKEMKVLMKIMTECWYHHPSARLTSLRIKKSIQALCQKQL